MDSEIFLVATPGLEAPLADEAKAAGFVGVAIVPGGVAISGGRDEVVRANFVLRGATRVLWRIASFRAMHPAQLDKRAHRVAWGDHLRPDVPVRVEAVCRKSRIYHAGAAQWRVEKAIADVTGAPIDAKASVVVKVRIEDDLCTISLDTSGESLHKRGHKVAVNKAPMRETMAAMFLRECGYRGDIPIYDPMCGSGTFVIEAAEIAAGLLAGRSRQFAFEMMTGFDRASADIVPQPSSPLAAAINFFGSDRDAGAIEMSCANAARAGVGYICRFECHSVSDMTPPCGTPGLVIVNPPYGGRIGKKGPLFGLYAAMGKALTERFSGWRVGLITTDTALAKATGLPFGPPGPVVAHGGMKIRLWQTGPLG